MNEKLQAWANLAAPLTLWALLWIELSAEWLLNDQYGFGLFVPLLGGYLVLRRWANRPEPAPAGRSVWLWLALGVMILLLYPFRIIYEANADWRLLTWVQALLTLAVTMGFLLFWGGWPWVKHFLPAIIFWLFANPWVSSIEQPIVLGLMSLVATWVVECANLLGIYAARSGNVIQLSTGLVSVQEACSGVRSLQSTLMAAYFLGELLRFRWPTRIWLILSGAGLAILFNFARTLTLTIVTAREGGEVMEQWHDPAGYMVFAMCVTGLLLLTAIAQTRRKDHNSAIDGAPMPGDFEPPRLLPTAPLAMALVAMLGSVPAAMAWYASRDLPQPFAGYDFNWDALPVPVRFDEIDPAIQEILHYQEGELGEWSGPGNLHWLTYFLRWDDARAAQLGGIHHPEACLPAGGWTQQEHFDDIIWKDPAGLELIFNSYRFSRDELNIYVFYCQWDRTNYSYFDKTGRFVSDRLKDAWRGQRKEGKIKLEIFVYGARSHAEALNQLQEILRTVIVPQPNTSS